VVPDVRRRAASVKRNHPALEGKRSSHPEALPVRYSEDFLAMLTEIDVPLAKKGFHLAIPDH
jgi:hypothetical protein